MTKSLDEAADCFLDKRAYSNDSGYDVWTDKDMEEAFKAGALWAEKHSPKVLALIEALEDIRDDAGRRGYKKASTWDKAVKAINAFRNNADTFASGVARKFFEGKEDVDL